jgi:UDP-N-acetylglucosamine--N-acetylmuramyl-(pentapeptide) pyrophosphoryl-undecaprenol N-acetylglucosamine transferase
MIADDWETLPSTRAADRRGEQRLRVLVSGGGTGGHIYPAVAVARELEQRFRAEILYIGDSDGLETRLVPEAGFRLVTIHAGRLQRHWSARTMRDLARVPIGFVEARRQVRAFAPHVAFTSGGYVAVPAGFATRRLGAPLLIHQQDVPPNLANRLLRRLATEITVSFEESLRYFPKSKTHVVGNPVRDAIVSVAGTDPRVHKRTLGFSPAFPLLVVTGGSQGARHVNQALVAALPRLLERFQVLHISGQRIYDETAAAASERMQGLPEHVAARYRLVPYLDDEMPIALAAADLIVARAGAATLAELAVLGKPSVLVPLMPGLGGSPQEANAAMFAHHGATRVILDAELSGERLFEEIATIFADPDTRARLGLQARTLARPDAARELAESVVALGQAYIEETRRRTVMQAIHKASR